MKIIFSRKGFDGTAGGCPSPIIEGRPLSLPIPTRMPSAVRFRDLIGPYSDLVTDLTRGRVTGENWCHCDPDIQQAARPRMEGWRGALGQVSSAQGHLAKQGVRPGDLFLFWGLFRNVSRTMDQWKFVGAAEHRIWGWLQIGEIIELGSDGSHALREKPWLIDHPHVRAGWGAQNVLYVAAEKLTLSTVPLRLPAYGVLSQGHRLTTSNQQKSTWSVPDWLHPGHGGSGMTYHPAWRWYANGTVKSAARGQEFVAAPPKGAADAWISSFLQEAA